MDRAVPLTALGYTFLLGLLFGVVLAAVLGLVRRLISRIDHPLAQDIAPYVYWILAAMALVDAYILYVRHFTIGWHRASVLALYLGAIIALVIGFVRRSQWRRLFPHAARKPAEQHPPTGWERAILSPTTLALAAFVCWCVSLALPVFIFNNRTEYQGGWDVLTRGWMGMLRLQFAWCANPLFMLAFVRLINGLGAIRVATVALLLSLETFLTEPALGAYGYGWGMVAWFMSLVMMAGAALAYESQGGRAVTFRHPGWGFSFGVGACLLGGLGVGALSYHDHHVANAAESQRLAHAAFKLGAVCSVELAKGVPPLVPLAGPLEIKQLSELSGNKPYDGVFLSGVSTWGAPALRSEGRDYFYIRSAREVLFTSVPAQGPAGATLVIDGSREAPHLRLLSAEGGVLFDQFWYKQAKGGEYCPDFSNYPSAGQQPRLLVSQALGLVAPSEEKRSTGESYPRLSGQVIGRTQGAVSQDEPVINTGCAEGVGWRQMPRLSWVIKSAVDYSFWIGQQAYYQQGVYHGRALCQGDYVFLYNTSQQGAGKALLTLEKRRLSDFAWVGSSAITVEYAGLDKQPLRLDRVDDAGQGLTVDVSRPALGLRLRVKGTAGL
jgi:hypothetical protein